MNSSTTAACAPGTGPTPLPPYAGEPCAASRPGARPIAAGRSAALSGALGLLLLSAAGAAAQTYPSLLAPADPARGGARLRYVPVTAGLKRFGVVGPKDWVALNRAVGPKAVPGPGPAAPEGMR
ncbi:hypothetical protein [Lichenibacterium dinghuense]|jgi:hypothetical protein|uniref:hypothetical protein n=1 Tax=Lichenibacterium dinghuense TaxID=2895977 RepID=UPI001F343FAE|nr:hypothetical protein [Lichenibacterium sp. 6Y81]